MVWCLRSGRRHRAEACRTQQHREACLARPSAHGSPGAPHANQRCALLPAMRVLQNGSTPSEPDLPARGANLGDLTMRD